MNFGVYHLNSLWVSPAFLPPPTHTHNTQFLGFCEAQSGERAHRTRIGESRRDFKRQRPRGPMELEGLGWRPESCGWREEATLPQAGRKGRDEETWLQVNGSGS